MVKTRPSLEYARYHFWNSIGCYGTIRSFLLCAPISWVGDSQSVELYEQHYSNLKDLILW